MRRQERQSRKIRFYIIISLIYFVLGGLLSAAIFSSPHSPKIQVKLYFLGEEIGCRKELSSRIHQLGRSFLASQFELYDGEGFKTTFLPRQIGVTIDYERIMRLINIIEKNKGDIASYIKKNRSALSGEEAKINLPVPVKILYQDAQDFLLNLKFSYDRKPQSARLDMESRKIIPHINGRMLLLDETISSIEMALTKGSKRAKMAVAIISPRRKVDELKEVDISTVLGWFETPYCRERRCWDRNHNLKLGAKILDGTIIWPGEIFDFNKVLGPRTEARGFRLAPTIEQGTLTMSPGGGTCQTASTLYAAAFFAGMELIQRRPHSRPSGYILLGLDATVTFPNINLIFRNPFDFPVVIHYKVENGKMRVEILGKERRRIVHFVRRITQQIPYREKIIEEPDWPKGFKVISQRGIDGYRVRRYRVIWEGSHVERELTENFYPPTPQIVHVGTNPSISRKGFAPSLKPDTRSPYHADKRIKIYMDEKGGFKKIIANW